MNGRAGLALCALAAVLWASGATVARLLIDDGVSSLELTELRALVTAIGFWLIATRIREPRRSSGGRGGVVALGVSLAAVNITYFMALERLPVAIAVIIQYTAPALVVGYELLVDRRRPSRATVIALLGVLIGVLFVSDAIGALGDGANLDPAGLLLAAGSAIGFAAYNLLAARTEPRFGAVRSHAIAFSVATLIWIVVQTPRGLPDSLLDASLIPGLAVVTIVGTVFAFAAYSAGIKRIGASQATIAATLEPVAVAVLAASVLDQSLTAIQIAGSVIVLASIASLRPREVAIPEIVRHDGAHERPRGTNETAAEGASA